MSLDVLNRHGAKQSICEQVAHALQIKFCYCDPPIEVQKKLGIKDPCRSSPSDFTCNPYRRGIDPEQRTADAIRERYWLNQLSELDAWPVLFVCGCNHTVTFPKLLESNGIVVCVLNAKWAPA